VRKLPALVGTKAQRVILTCIGPAKVGYHGSIWSEAGPRQHHRITSLDAGWGNTYLWFLLRMDHRDKQQ